LEESKADKPLNLSIKKGKRTTHSTRSKHSLKSSVAPAAQRPSAPAKEKCTSSKLPKSFKLICELLTFVADEFVNKTKLFESQGLEFTKIEVVRGLDGSLIFKVKTDCGDISACAPTIVIPTMITNDGDEDLQQVPLDNEASSSSLDNSSNAEQQEAPTTPTVKADEDEEQAMSLANSDKACEDEHVAPVVTPSDSACDAAQQAACLSLTPPPTDAVDVPHPSSDEGTIITNSPMTVVKNMALPVKIAMPSDVSSLQKRASLFYHATISIEGMFTFQRQRMKNQHLLYLRAQD